MVLKEEPRELRNGYSTTDLLLYKRKSSERDFDASSVLGTDGEEEGGGGGKVFFFFVRNMHS